MFKGNNFLMVAYENGHTALIENCITNYEITIASAMNEQNKRKDNLLLRAIKDQNQYLIQFLLNNSKIEYNVKDEVDISLSKLILRLEKLL
jgi:hypothetical protein